MIRSLDDSQDYNCFQSAANGCRTIPSGGSGKLRGTSGYIHEDPLAIVSQTRALFLTDFT
jgi:hypothetical protein